jgi:glycosyltransferase involved in cell wall biosynthesis
MQIAYVDIFQHIPASSGNNWYTLQLVSDLQDIGDVTLYSTQQRDGKRGYVPADSAVRQEFLATSVKLDKIWPRLNQLRPEMLFDSSAVKSIEANIVFTRLYSYHIARHIAKNNKALLVLVMQNIEWQYLKNARYTRVVYAPVRLYENYALRRAAALISLSEKDYAYATTITSAEKVFYVPPRPNSAIFNADSSLRYEYGTDKLNVLFFGCFDSRHNIKAAEFIQRSLVPAMKQQGLLDSFQINVFGSGAPPTHLDLENDEEICFFGCVEDPGPYIKGADVVIVPVRNSSGVKIRVLEALACEKPVIAFPEATAGLEKDAQEAVTIASSTEEFVTALKSFVQRDGVSPAVGTNPLSCSLKVTTAREAALHALGC